MLSLRCTEYIRQGKHLGRKKKSKKHLMLTSTMYWTNILIQYVERSLFSSTDNLLTLLHFNALILPYPMSQCWHKSKITVVWFHFKSHIVITGLIAFQKSHQNNSSLIAFQKSYQNNSGFVAFQKSHKKNSGLISFQNWHQNNSGLIAFQNITK